MKKAFSILMIAVWLVVFIFFGTSCDVLKNRTSKTEIVKEHHYHDSTFMIENMTIREISAKPDSTKAYFDLQALLKSGYGKSTDRYFTTEVVYKDNGILVTTSIDSLISIVKELQRQTVKSTVQQQLDKNIESTEETKTKESKVQSIIISVIVLILLLLCLVAFVYYKFFLKR